MFEVIFSIFSLVGAVNAVTNPPPYLVTEESEEIVAEEQECALEEAQLDSQEVVSNDDFEDFCEEE